MNGTEVSVSEFPRLALNQYLAANLSSPNRAINILGIARAYSQMRSNNQAERVYQILLDQITSSNTSDPIFAQEANDFISQKQALQNVAKKNQFSLSSIFIVFLLFTLFYK